MVNNLFDFGNKDAEVRFFVFLSVALSMVLITSYVLGSRVERGDVSSPTEIAEREFPDITLQAKAAYVYDARTKTVLYAKGENTRLPLASLTKVMSALVAYELSPNQAAVVVERAALEAMGDSGLLSGERWRLKDLLDFSLVTSSNDGMRAAALALGALESSGATTDEKLQAFVNQMNRKAVSLDLKNTYFWNETGLDETEFKGGAYGTAKDMARLIEYVLMYHPTLLEATREPGLNVSSLSEVRHEGRNTNTLVGSIPGLIASKTGYTNTAGGNLVLAFDPELGRPIIISILGSTERGRFEDAQILINATLQYITTK